MTKPRHNPNLRVQAWQLRQRQALPLDIKVRISERRIRQWYEHWEGGVAVSVSGGLDSTALLHLVRSLYPEVPGVFFDTGLEYPENRDLVASLPNIVWRKPTKGFRDVIRQYGYPVVSKRVAQYVGEVQRSRGETATKRLRLTGITSKGTMSPMGKIPDKWIPLCSAPFAVSDRCCHYLKKRPSHIIERERGWHMILGTRAAEGNKRELSYLHHGCNAFHLKHPRSAPLAFWTHEDIESYLALHGLRYSALYDMGYSRSGCMFCMFGVHLEPEPNRFQRMRETHPKQWRYCIDVLGCRQVLEFIRVPYGSDRERAELLPFPAAATSGARP